MKEEQEKQKSFEYWTIEEFEALPLIKDEKDIGSFESLIILPTKEIHDSGFRIMYFVVVKKNIPIYRISGASDVLHRLNIWFIPMMM